MSRKLSVVSIIFLAAVFTIGTKTAFGATLTCNDGTTDCGYIAQDNLGWSTCLLVGTASQGGQTCNSAGAVTGPGAWVNQGYSQVTVPNVDTRDVYESIGVYPNSSAQMSVSSFDDNGTVSVGNMNFSYMGCTCGPHDQADPGCGGTGSGNGGLVSGTISPGNTMSLTAINACQPNGQGAWGGGGANLTLPSVAHCYTPAYFNWAVQNGYLPASDAGRGYSADPTTPGRCDAVSTAQCSISSFTAAPGSVVQGASATLHFSLNNPGNLPWSIAAIGGGSNPTPSSGNGTGGIANTGNLNSTQTYQLSCGSSIAQTMVVVVRRPTLSCSPVNQTAGIGQNITVTARDGVPPYNWFGGGAPATGSGSSFTTSYSTTGNYSVYLTDSDPNDGTPACTVSVNTAPPVASGKINADPNPCQTTGTSTVCTSYITWNTANVTDARVFVTDQGSGYTAQFSGNNALSCSGTSCPAPWISAGDSYVFNLYDYSSGSQGALLSSVTVAGEAPLCGSSGQSCCVSGSSCQSGLSCQSGVCKPTSGPSCGGNGQSCCPTNPSCGSGLSCQGGTCTPGSGGPGGSGLCGTAAATYASTDNGYGIRTFCSAGTSTRVTGPVQLYHPPFPALGATSNWKCVATGGTSQLCAASRVNIPDVSPSCGTANAYTFPYTSTDYGGRTICSSGAPTPPSSVANQPAPSLFVNQYTNPPNTNSVTSYWKCIKSGSSNNCTPLSYGTAPSAPPSPWPADTSYWQCNSLNPTCAGWDYMPPLPDPSGVTQWSCVGSGPTQVDTASCDAYRAAAPNVNGVCGTADTNSPYPYPTTGYGGDTFCSAGNAQPASPSFPPAGGSVTWSCLGTGNGKTAFCGSSHDSNSGGPSCTTLRYNPSTSGFSLNAAGPAQSYLQITSGQAFYAFVDYGRANIDSIIAPNVGGSYACVFDTFLGTVARFTCANAPTAAGSYDYTTGITPGTTSNDCVDAEKIGSGVTVVYAPPTCSALTANPSAIIPPESSLLKWSCKNVSTCTINGSTVVGAGSMSVSPATTTLYTLTCNGFNALSPKNTVIETTIVNASSPSIIEINP